MANACYKKCGIEPKIRAEINYYYKLYFQKINFCIHFSLVLLAMLLKYSRFKIHITIEYLMSNNLIWKETIKNQMMREKIGYCINIYIGPKVPYAIGMLATSTMQHVKVLTTKASAHIYFFITVIIIVARKKMHKYEMKNHFRITETPKQGVKSHD